MTELINALIRLANAAALYFEQQTHPKMEIASGDENIGTDVPASAVGTKRARKPRAVKVEAAAPVAVAATVAVAAPASAPAPTAPASDPLAELGLPASAPVAVAAPAVPNFTPEQSVLEMKKIAVKCVQVFKNDTPNGEARLTGLLADKYKVNRLSELTHENRLDFIGQVQAIIVAGGKA